MKVLSIILGGISFLIMVASVADDFKAFKTGNFKWFEFASKNGAILSALVVGGGVAKIFFGNIGVGCGMWGGVVFLLGPKIRELLKK